MSEPDMHAVIEQLEQIAARIGNANMPRLIGIKEISAMMGRSESTVLQRIVCRPGFPEPSRITGTRLWFLDEVEQYLRKNRSLETGKRSGRPRRGHDSAA